MFVERQPRVYHKHDPSRPCDAIYVGRPTKWGNPFRLTCEAERALVIMRYAIWLQTQPALIAAARVELRGKDLVCWCAPKRCHADVLIHIANE